MTRKKVKLAFIVNDASKKATYKKKKKGLLKKVNELSILCGIKACTIIYGPYEAQPELWLNIPGSQRAISKLKRMPKMEQSKKMMNQESFIRQRIVKVTENFKKQMENNKEKEMRKVMYQCLTGARVQNLGMGELNHLGRVVDQNLKEIRKWIEVLAKGEGLVNKEVFQVKEHKPSVGFGMEAMNRPQWFNDWVSNQNEQIGFGGGLEMMLPFGDGNNNATWSSFFFP